MTLRRGSGEPTGRSFFGRPLRFSYGVIVVATVISGCRSVSVGPPLEPIPLKEAVGLVNANTSRAGGTIRAIGNVDGSLRDVQGKRRSYSVDGTLFFLAPDHVRFDLKKLGERQFLFGCDSEQYWFFDRETKKYSCGPHGRPSDLPEDMPIRPDQIADALGLRRFPDGSASDSSVRMVQRVTEEYQQVRVLESEPGGGGLVQKEFWLDRRAPRLVRRVVFREADGSIQLESQLSDFRRIGPGGPFLPHEMVAHWPKKNAHMRFRVSKWSLMPEVSENGPQFAVPADCQP